MPDSSIPTASPQASPIEFRCPNCQKLLRIAAAAAGKQAQCPECRTAMIVPKPPELDRQATPVDATKPFGNSVASHPQDALSASPAFGAGQNPMPPAQAQDAPSSMAASLIAAPTAAPSQAQPQSMSHLLFSTPSAQT